MWFFKRKKEKRKGQFYEDKDALVLYFKCENCGEVFRSYLRKGYDIATDYSGETKGKYFIRKEYIGTKCPNIITLYAVFDENYNPIVFELNGAKVIDKEEFGE